MKQYRVISADSHAIEPPDLWQCYLPHACKDRGPRVISESTGDIWVCEGMPSHIAKRPMGAVARNSERAYTAAAEGAKRYATDTNDWNPDARVEYMRQDGVDAEVLYPNYAMRAFGIPDPDLQQAVCQAYNDWLSDFCSTHPRELFGIAIIPVFDVDWSIRECRRAKEKGLVGVLLPRRIRLTAHAIRQPNGTRCGRRWPNSACRSVSILLPPAMPTPIGRRMKRAKRARRSAMRSCRYAWRGRLARLSWRACLTAIRV